MRLSSVRMMIVPSYIEKRWLEDSGRLLEPDSSPRAAIVIPIRGDPQTSLRAEVNVPALLSDEPRASLSTPPQRRRKSEPRRARTDGDETAFKLIQSPIHALSDRSQKYRDSCCNDLLKKKLETTKQNRQKRVVGYAVTAATRCRDDDRG